MTQLATQHEKIKPRLGITPKLRHCLDAVTTHCDVAMDDLFRRCKYRRICESRQLVFWLARQLSLTYSEIGARMGFDHTTVISGIKQVERRRADDGRYLELTQRLLTSITSTANSIQLPPSEPLPEEEPTIAVQPVRRTARLDPNGQVNFYHAHQDDRRSHRAYLEEQNERFIAAMKASGEKPLEVMPRRVQYFRFDDETKQFVKWP